MILSLQKKIGFEVTLIVFDNVKINAKEEFTDERLLYVIDAIEVEIIFCGTGTIVFISRRFFYNNCKWLICKDFAGWDASGAASCFLPLGVDAILVPVHWE